MFRWWISHVLLLGLPWLAGVGDARAETVAWGQRLFLDDQLARPGAAVSCRSCHQVSGAGEAGGYSWAGGDGKARSGIPERGDGRVVTVRNSPALLDALEGPRGGMLLHYDGEFASAERLVVETFLGRNFGWLPEERAVAVRHVARAVRDADSSGLTRELGDEPAIDAAARAVADYLRTLRFSRDARGEHNGSAYDAFLELNRLPRAPRAGQSAAEYGARLNEQIAALRAPRFVADGAGEVRFGEAELRGMRIFFRGAIGAGQVSGAGNCAECHVPPQFTDFKFHNTGSAQDDYDAAHGEGTFAALVVPSLVERRADPTRWLPATAVHPQGQGPFLALVEVERPGRTDLGAWNVYGNPELPEVQGGMERLLNPSGRFSAEQVLATSVARFKTTTVRDLARTAPYLHTGHVRTIEDVVLFYRRMADISRAGKLRNAPPEYFGMRLGDEDTAPLAAFLRSLNEGERARAADPAAR